MIEIGDELSEDPSLVWVRDTAVAVLHHGLGDHRPPREVAQLHLLQLCLADPDRRLLRRRGQLIGEREHGVEAVCPGEIDVASDLLLGELGGPCLDFEQGCPHLLAPLNDDRPVGDGDLAIDVRQADL